MSQNHEGRLPRGAVTRSLVYAGLIAVSIVIWWAVIRLVADVSAGF